MRRSMCRSPGKRISPRRCSKTPRRGRRGGGGFGFGQILEGTLITPKLVGDRIGLHPVAVIFAVLAGGQLFGFFGVLLALPAAAVMLVWLRHLHGDYIRSAAVKPVRKSRRR